jgi:DnaK suppressor protein
MDDTQLTHFRDKLEDISKNILTGADKTISEMTDHSDNYPDPTDRAAAESDRSFELRLRDRERKLLGKIREALDRIDNGTYGTCEECGDEIAAARLEARPVTTYCIDCKTRQEQEERAKA